MKTARPLRLATAAIIAGALALTGCATHEVDTEPSRTGDDPGINTEVERAAESGHGDDAEASPEGRLIDVSAGDEITDEEAEWLPEGQTAHGLQDGTLIVVDAEEELPDPIVNEVTGLIADTSTYEQARRTRGAMQDAIPRAQNIAMMTDRHVVIVYYAHSYDQDGNLVQANWVQSATGDVMEMLRNSSFDFFQPITKEEAVASAEELIAQSEYPEQYQIIVHE